MVKTIRRSFVKPFFFFIPASNKIYRGQFRIDKSRRDLLSNKLRSRVLQEVNLDSVINMHEHPGNWFSID